MSGGIVSNSDILTTARKLLNPLGDALSKYPRWLTAETAAVVRGIVRRRAQAHGHTSLARSCLLVRADSVDDAATGGLINRAAWHRPGAIQPGTKPPPRFRQCK
jgi:hypothetical protein